jgi:hypothetical protein
MDEACLDYQPKSGAREKTIRLIFRLGMALN